MSYPGVEATCPFNDCAVTGPIVSITVTTVSDGATGSLESEPDGVKIKGTGTAQWGFENLDIRFTAEPLGSHARARFTGGCIATGEYGKKVTCDQFVRVIGPDSLPIAVSYECEPAFTCKSQR